VRVHWSHDEEGGVSIAEVGFGHHTADDMVRAQFEVLMEALEVYAKRNPKYDDNWRRFGWRGCLFRLRERVERLWDYLWDHPTQGVPHGEDSSTPDSPDVDDAIDLINFAAFLVRAVRADNRDGSWWAQP
jgi:hypothetical protein